MNYWDILSKSAEIAEERQEDYGNVRVNLENTARILEEMFGEIATPQAICKVLIALKVAREKNRHKSDNILDVINYFAILEHLNRDDFNIDKQQTI